MNRSPRLQPGRPLVRPKQIRLASIALWGLVFFASLASLSRASEQTLDLGWRFHRGEIAGAEALDFADGDWRSIDLPHDWSIENLPAGEGITGPHDPNAPDGSDVGYVHGGVGWYRRTLIDAERPAGSGLELIVHGAQQESDIWVNGTHVHFQPHGYVPARVEIGPFLRPRPQANVIAIRVSNPERNSRFYSGSGLYRNVTLRGHDDLFVPTWGTRIDTLWIDGERASVHVRVQVQNDRTSARDVDLDVELVAPDGTTTQHPLGQLRLSANATEYLNAWLWLKNAQPWSPETPRLYRAHFRIRESGRLLDECDARFGLRTLALSTERGLLLNGTPIKLRGGNLHHDNGLLGARAFADAERRRVRLMKENGFNAIRTAHNPPSIAFLDACDEAGVLVIDEFSDSWQLPKKPNGYQRYFDQHAERDLTTMIARDFNHPSIIFWSIGNEIPERFNPAGVEIGRRLRAIVHREDPLRFVTASVNLLWEDPSVHGRWETNDPAFSVLDVGGYNYMWEKYESDHARFPQRVMYGAETYPNEALENWNAVERLPYVVGDFVWSAMDYLGESGIGHTGYVDTNATITKDQDASHLPWPAWNSWCGDLDVIGDKKPPSLYRDVVWRRSALEILVHEPIPAGKKEKVGSWGWPAELPSWNWAGHEGEMVPVSVYTRANRVRLSLNGKVIGEQDIDSAKGITAHFNVPWSAGTLTATALNGETVVARKELHTTGPAAQLRIEPEAASAASRPDRSKLIYVPISVVDAHGALVREAALPLEIKVEGEAELCAFGAGDPRGVGPLADAATQSFRGRALAILRCTGKPGDVRVVVSTPGIPPAIVTIPIGAPK